jgi:hypothetical protein
MVRERLADKFSALRRRLDNQKNGYPAPQSEE